MSNPWDNFINIFGTIKAETDITSTNADNILIAWPVILEFIKKFGKTTKGTHLLEYGCGTGSFANKLHERGFNVTGIDTSEELIKTAKSAFDKNIHFLIGDATILSNSEKNKYPIITSIQTFPFIKDIETTFYQITNVIDPGGIFIFTVFNPSFVKECMRLKILFENFDSFEKPKTGIFNYDGNKIPVYIRNAFEYNNLLQKLGFEKLLETYPLFTDEFFRKYPMPYHIQESEYLILGYRKI